MRKIGVLGTRNHRSAAVRPGAPPPGSASGMYMLLELAFLVNLVDDQTAECGKP